MSRIVPDLQDGRLQCRRRSVLGRRRTDWMHSRLHSLSKHSPVLQERIPHQDVLCQQVRHASLARVTLFK
jgi:hypothetical protein